MIRLDLKTKTEKEREQKHKSICNMYVDYRQKYPNVAPHRLFDAIGQAFSMTGYGIKNILVRANLYSTNPSNK